MNIRQRYREFNEFLERFYISPVTAHKSMAGERGSDRANSATQKGIESVCEALVGAEWISGGWQALHWLDGVLEARTDETGGRDATMLLQEIRQGDGKSRPTYTYRASGSGHEPKYQCQVFFDDVRRW